MCLELECSLGYVDSLEAAGVVADKPGETVAATDM